MDIKELKKRCVGKKISETTDVDFGTCYPLVEFSDIKNKSAVIIGIVCAEFGDYDSDLGIDWDNNGEIAWEKQEAM